jgi:hypothetical protein
MEMTRVLAVDLVWKLIGAIGCFEITEVTLVIGEDFVESTNNYWLYYDKTERGPMRNPDGGTSRR